LIGDNDQTGCTGVGYEGALGGHKKGEEHDEKIRDENPLNQGKTNAEASIKPTNKEPFKEMVQEDSKQTKEKKH